MYYEELVRVCEHYKKENINLNVFHFMFQVFSKIKNL